MEGFLPKMKQVERTPMKMLRSIGARSRARTSSVRGRGVGLDAARRKAIRSSVALASGLFWDIHVGSL